MLINIQFLRFAAALLVVLYHASSHVRATGVDQGMLFAAGEAVGFAGVDIFFVISGFIMLYTTTDEKGTGSSIQFMKRRLARIYSGYWPFFFAAMAVFYWARPGHFANADLLQSFALWPQPLPHVLLDVSWTLTYEMYFYLLFSALVLVGLRLRTAFVLGMLVLTLGFNIYRHWIAQGFSTENLYLLGFFDQFLTSPFLAEFFAGALLASWLKPDCSRFGWLVLGLGALGFACAGWVNVTVFDGGVEQGFFVVPRVLMFGIPSTLLVAGLVLLERSGHVAPFKFSLLAGGASYALYLCHTLFFIAAMKMGAHSAMSHYSAFQVQVIYLLFVSLIVAFSIAHYHWAEKPLHRLFKKMLRVRPGNPPPA
jgi:peptidoglycan/LPS O-acetylase OafA/YrhL